MRASWWQWLGRWLGWWLEWVSGGGEDIGVEDDWHWNYGSHLSLSHDTGYLKTFHSKFTNVQKRFFFPSKCEDEIWQVTDLSTLNPPLVIQSMNSPLVIQSLNSPLVIQSMKLHNECKKSGNHWCFSLTGEVRIHKLSETLPDLFIPHTLKALNMANHFPWS